MRFVIETRSYTFGSAPVNMVMGRAIGNGTLRTLWVLACGPSQVVFSDCVKTPLLTHQR